MMLHTQLIREKVLSFEELCMCDAATDNHLLSFYCVLGTVLCAGNTAVNKTVVSLLTGFIL